MFGVMLRIQRAFNRWFEKAILEDRYRYLARRGGFERDFDRHLEQCRQAKRYSPVRMAYSEARYEYMKKKLATHLGTAVKKGNHAE